ncbi:hypothetical protein GLOIN_2v618130 [Rhizophagus irregularis DAOM 181602=DAOM 197198]|nr:hypothetical protein GLOIN_2v618130 [Rhizophagus irregularis DAOM 181602=DAOM 197198]POG82800.1 hypothetical protein GLOIN_2v618130 [Rhizophagus irregularis DAOM 181602=DAOM 197198]|eukprot:XP_025189666.1 hypothetical protein GLOIN_2v618130 [Rhizophagus irregularis DAOM 181602=DAOM 197198]
MFPQKNPLESSNILNYLKRNLICWTSRNEKIDNFIQEMQLKFNNKNNVVFEWIPYNQFNEIKETDKNGLITLYSAIWKDGPILFDYNWYNGYTRVSNKKVALKCLHNSQDSIDFLMNEAKMYSTNYNAFITLYGISQDPDTNNYILVQNNSINLANWISGNEKINDFIQEMQLKIMNHYDDVFEWIPYNQLDKIKESGKNNFTTVHSAIWKNGPLFYSDLNKRYIREPNTNVALKYLHSSQNSIEILTNEVKKQLTSIFGRQITKIYGISQNPDTSDYILVQKNFMLMSGDKKIDDFIQEIQLKINDYNDVVFEWIPYNQFNEIEEIGKNTNSITMYSAVWKDGRLLYNYQYQHYTRDSSIEVSLRCLHNSENSIDFLINEAKKYLPKKGVLFGISQNPDTNDYILVQNNFMNLANFISGNEKIDDFIQEMNNHKDVVFEWIPYDQFDEIEEIDNDGLTVYYAIWKNGPLCYVGWNFDRYTRDSSKMVGLKYLYNSLNSVDSLINEV